jgi:regulatory protein YycH of two-component signal transduction system YycFG
MNSMSKRFESGFAVLETVLVVIAVVLIIFTGYYVWHSQKTADKTLTDTNKSSQSTVATTPAVKDESAAIKTAVMKYNDAKGGISVSYTVEIEHQNAQYALGVITAESGDSGGQWFAKKTDGKWAVVSQGADGHCDELAAVNLASWDETCTVNQ